MSQRPKSAEEAAAVAEAVAPQAAAPEAAPTSEAEPAPRVLPEPIGTVRRTLVRPDGTKIAVDVPIYPPFRLESGAAAPPPLPRRPRKGPKPRPTGSD